MLTLGDTTIDDRRIVAVEMSGNIGGGTGELKLFFDAGATMLFTGDWSAISQAHSALKEWLSIGSPSHYRGTFIEKRLRRLNP